MAPYYPIYVSRSDGMLEIASKKRNERNEPTKEQQDATPSSKGISDFYKLLEHDEPKTIDWRRKLGGMLMKQVGGNEAAGDSYILARLPENYRLYEHLKYMTVDGSGKPQSARISARGPNERQDAYLYGHPGGRKKRFRSPADFFPHLLWLATDEKGDPGNCACKLCAPKDIQVTEKTLSGAALQDKSKKAAKKEAKSPEKTKKFATKPVFKQTTKSSTSSANSSISTSSKTAAPLKSMKSRPALPPAPGSYTPPVRQSEPSLKPTPLPPIRSAEQEVDLTYNRFVFRPGELVWFSRGAAWGLAVILKREQYQNDQGQRKPSYTVQPLSHPLSHPEPKVLPDDNFLRPWLAWSAPGPTHSLLGRGNLTYDTVDWTAVLKGQLGTGDAEVDGSIFAAKSIDESYTLISPVPTPTAGNGEKFWNGMYLGAEKIWVGEPVRLRVGSGNDIMILQEIVEKNVSGLVNQRPVSMVYLVGDIYTITVINQLEQQSRHVPTEDPNLPQRLQIDLQFRNSATASARSSTSYWKLTRSMGRLTLAEIKGRWYESSLLLPILRGDAQFSQDIENGDITDTGIWMNGRGDALSSQDNSQNKANKTGYKRNTRREALGRSVPTNTQISPGLQGPPADTRTSNPNPGLPPMTGSPANPMILE